MSNTKFGNISRNDVVVFKDEASGDAPIDLADINATGGAASRILAINSGNTALEWIPAAGSAAALSALSDCVITSPADGAVLVYDTGTAKWRDFTLSGAVTMNDSGVVTLASSIVGVANLKTTAGEIGTRLIGVQATAANGSEVLNEIAVSIGFVTLAGVAIDFSSGWGGLVPAVRVLVSSSLSGPKRHSSAYVSAVTQGTALDGLNTAECVIVGTEPATGTHAVFKVKLTTAGSVYVWLGTPDCSYWTVFQYNTAPITVTFA